MNFSERFQMLAQEIQTGEYWKKRVKQEYPDRNVTIQIVDGSITFIGLTRYESDRLLGKIRPIQSSTHLHCSPN
jgi:hypothetical protein